MVSISERSTGAVASEDLHEHSPKTQNTKSFLSNSKKMRMPRSTLKDLNQAKQGVGAKKPSQATSQNHSRSSVSPASISNKESPNDTEERTKTIPILTGTYELELSECQVTFELIKNNRSELFFIMRSLPLDGEAPVPRIALPYSRLPAIIDGLCQGLARYQDTEEESILDVIKNSNAVYANMFQTSSGLSRYYVDFILNKQKDDVKLKFTERKRVNLNQQSNQRMDSSNKNVKSFQLYFHKDDLVNLIEHIQNFQQSCISHLEENESDAKESLNIFRFDQYTFEWIEQKNTMNILLKISHMSNRIIYPISICKQVVSTLQKLKDLYEAHGEDTEAYFGVMQREREELNNKRIEKGRQKLADLSIHPNTSSNTTFASSAARNESPEPQEEFHTDDSNASSHNQRSVATPLVRMYSTRINSIQNRRSYHFDIVKNNEKNAVNVRLVEIQRYNASPAVQNNANSRKGPQNQRFRHNLNIDITLLPDFIENLKGFLDNSPLPKEEAHYFNGGRCFMKFNIRNRGLTLRIKTQQINKEDEQLNQQEDGEKATPQHRYTNTGVVELQIPTVQRVFRYLANNCPFQIPDVRSQN